MIFQKNYLMFPTVLKYLKNPDSGHPVISLFLSCLTLDTKLSPPPPTLPPPTDQPKTILGER